MTDNSPSITSEVPAAAVKEIATEQQTNVTVGTEFNRSDEIYREAAELHTIVPAPSPSQDPEPAPVEQSAISAADIAIQETTVTEASETLLDIPVEEPSASPAPLEHEVEAHVTEEVPQSTSPEPSLLSRFTALFEAPEGKEATRSDSILDRVSNFCDNLKDSCAAGAREYAGTLWGTFLGFASNAFGFFGSITESISSVFESDSDLSSEEREYYSQSITLEELRRQENLELSVQAPQSEAGFEAGDIAILRNDRIRRMKELLEQLHEAMEQYREHHEREEEQENEDEIEFHFQKQDDLIEVVKEIQDLLPDHPKVREALETYRVEKYRDELPPDLVYQQMRDILAEAIDEETQT